MKKILLIDDNQELVDTLLKQLSIMGYDTLFAYNGEEGLAIINDEEINIGLIISDIDMPVMNGVDMISKITSKIPIIVYSGLADEFMYLEREFEYVKKVLNKPQSYIFFKNEISKYFQK